MEIGIWSCTVAPKKPLTVDPPAAVRITNVALGDVLADSSARTTVKLTYNNILQDDESDGDEPSDTSKSSTFICALTPGKIEQVSTNIVLEDKEEYVLEVVGPNTVYLTGNYLDQRADMPPYDDSDMDSEEDAFDLQDVSSDVEMDPDELDDEARFEEIDEALHGVQDTLKRIRDSGGEEEKLHKKQKAESGKAIKPDAPEAKDKKDKKDKKKDKNNDDVAEKTDGQKTEKKQAGVERELAGGTKIKDTKVGTGPMVKKGNTVSMRYIGKLQNGKVFDSNTKGKPFTFRLGKGEVIKGWDEGIVGMQVGGERLLTVPPAMGYGKRGTEGIPANATLIFEVKLTGLK